MYTSIIKCLCLLYLFQILPIESSMEGNRHNFIRFLYGAVTVLTMLLACFGVLGYLRFGNDVEQMINANIPSGQWLSVAVNSCLCVGVLLTFPLMMYPVVELAELRVFGDGELTHMISGYFMVSSWFQGVGI